MLLFMFFLLLNFCLPLAKCIFLFFTFYRRFDHFGLSIKQIENSQPLNNYYSEDVNYPTRYLKWFWFWAGIEFWYYQLSKLGFDQIKSLFSWWIYAPAVSSLGLPKNRCLLVLFLFILESFNNENLAESAKSFPQQFQVILYNIMYYIHFQVNEDATDEKIMIFSTFEHNDGQ